MEDHNEQRDLNRMLIHRQFSEMDIQDNHEFNNNNNNNSNADFDEEQFFQSLQDEEQEYEDQKRMSQNSQKLRDKNMKIIMKQGMNIHQQQHHPQQQQQNQKRKTTKVKQLEQLPLTKKLLIYLLRSTFDSNHNQDMNQKYSEDRIFREFRNNCAQTMTLLIEIINEPSESFEQDQEQQQGSNNQMNSFNKNIIQKSKTKMGVSDLVKTSAAIQLGQINRSFLQQVNMSENDRFLLVQGIIIILCNQNNCSQIKKHITKALTSILEKENNEIKDRTLGFIQQLLFSNELHKQIGSMLSIDSIIRIPLSPNQIQFILNQFLSPLFSFGEQLFKIGCEGLSLYQAQIAAAKGTFVKNDNDWDDETIDRYKVPSEELEGKLSFLESWSSLMNRIIGLLSFKKSTLSQEASFNILNQQSYFEILQKLLCMQLFVEEQIRDCLISFNTSYTIDSQLNSNLVNYLKIVSRFIKLLLRHRNQDFSLPEALKNTPFCIMLKWLIPKAVESLKGLNQFLITYESMYNEYKVEEAKNQIMHIVKQSLKISELSNYFFEMRVQFICDYIAPLLMVTNNDFDDFKKFGGSYLQYLHDFLNFDSKEKNKNSAASLIVKYCKYVHGALSFFVTFFLENVHSIINQIDCTDPSFQVLNQANGSLLKEKYQNEEQLDMSLVTLIAVRKQIKQRKDLLDLVDQFFINNCQLITTIKDTSLTNFGLSQLLLFFAEMSDSILLQQEDIFIKYVNALVECTQDWNTLQGFQFQVYQNIYDICKSKKTQHRLKPIACQIYQILLDQIENRQKCEIYYECLNAIVQQYRDQIFQNEQILYNFVNVLVGKIFSSCTLSKNRSKIHLEGVKNPLLILELVIQWEGVPDQMIMQLDNYLLPLYQTMQTSKEHDLSISVLKLLRLQIQRLNGVQTETALQSLYYMRDVFNKEEIMVFEIYKIINFIIQKQPSLLAQNHQLFQFFLELGIDGMKSVSRFSSPFDRSLGCLIVHLMMHHFNTLIKPEAYKLIIQGACASMKQEFYEQYLETRLSEVILSCFEIDIDMTVQELQQLKWLEKILDILLNKVGIFQEIYDKKLYIIGCCKLLSCYQRLPFIQTSFVQLFTRVLEMLQSVKSEQDFIQKQLQNKKTIEERVIIKKKQPEINSYSVCSSSSEKEDGDDSDNDCGYYKGKYNDNTDFGQDDRVLNQIYMKSNDMGMETQQPEVVLNRKKLLAAAHHADQRDQQAMYEDPNDFQKVQKYMQNTFIEDLPEIRNCFNLGALEKNSDNSYEDLRKLKRAQKSLKLLYTPLKKLDEFSIFQKMFQDLKDQLGQDISQLTQNLTTYQIQNLQEILQIQRIVNQQEVPEEAQAIRKIVKLRRKQQNQQD